MSTTYETTAAPKLSDPGAAPRRGTAKTLPRKRPKSTAYGDAPWLKAKADALHARLQANPWLRGTLSKAGRRLLADYGVHARLNEAGEVWVSKVNAAVIGGVGRATIRRQRKRLEELGVIGHVRWLPPTGDQSVRPDGKPSNGTLLELLRVDLAMLAALEAGKPPGGSRPTEHSLPVFNKWTTGSPERTTGSPKPATSLFSPSLEDRSKPPPPSCSAGGDPEGGAPLRGATGSHTGDERRGGMEGAARPADAAAVTLPRDGAPPHGEPARPEGEAGKGGEGDRTALTALLARLAAVLAPDLGGPIADPAVRDRLRDRLAEYSAAGWTLEAAEARIVRAAELAYLDRDGYCWIDPQNEGRRVSPTERVRRLLKSQRTIDKRLEFVPSTPSTLARAAATPQPTGKTSCKAADPPPTFEQRNAARAVVGDPPLTRAEYARELSRRLWVPGRPT